MGSSSDDDDELDVANAAALLEAMTGVLLTLAGTFVQSVQYAYEEKVMSGDISAPPWLLIGVEGVTGTLILTLILYPVAYFLPGPDHGSFEDPFNTIAKISNSPTGMACCVPLIWAP